MTREAGTLQNPFQYAYHTTRGPVVHSTPTDVRTAAPIATETAAPIATPTTAAAPTGRGVRPRDPPQTRSVSKRLKTERERAEKKHQLLEEMICAVCREVWTNPYSVSACGHTFCHHCISRSFSTNGSKCPECRAVATTLTPCRVGRFLVDKIVTSRLSVEERERRLIISRHVEEETKTRARNLHKQLLAFSRVLRELNHMKSMAARNTVMRPNN